MKNHEAHAQAGTTPRRWQPATIYPQAPALASDAYRHPAHTLPYDAPGSTLAQAPSPTASVTCDSLLAHLARVRPYITCEPRLLAEHDRVVGELECGDSARALEEKP